MVFIHLSNAIAMTHRCSCCQQCQSQLSSLRQRNQSLVADYASLIRKQQLTQQLESAYQSHQRLTNSTIHKHSQTIQQHRQILQQQSNTIQQQKITIQQQDNIILQQNERIQQIETQLNSMKNKNRTQFGLAPEVIQDEQYRKDLSLSQQLHRVIDAKNRDLIEMKQKIQSIQAIEQENQQFKSTIARLNQTLTKVQNHNNQLQAERLGYSKTIEVPKSQSPPLVQTTNSYVLPERSVAVRSTVQRGESTREDKLLSSVLDSLKITPMMSSTIVNSPNNHNRADWRVGWPPNGNRQYREHKQKIQQLQRSRQLQLIRSRISQLQQQNNILRGQLTSKI